jgi:hypothetical protein
MPFQNFLSLISRILFGTAFVLFGVAIVERLVNLGGYTILSRHYTPGRLLEFAALILLFVIALLLRSIREELRRE